MNRTPRDSRKHQCAAAGCQLNVPLKLLMCFRHWSMVPRGIQARIWREYKDGQEVNGGQTDGYREAVRAAVDAIEKRERESAARRP